MTPPIRRDRQAMLAALEAQGVVLVFHHPDSAAVVEIVRASVRAGAPVVEFTHRGDFAIDVFGEATRVLARTDPQAMLGLGSVSDAATAALAMNRGARFIVSPGLIPEVARTCNRRLVPYLPGCGSVTEIGQAHELGCDVVKLFPGASVGGPDFIRAVRGPMPWTRIMPTGGVEPEAAALKPWFDAGVMAVGLGSRLLPQDAVDAGDWAAIEGLIRAAVEAARRVRGG